MIRPEIDGHFECFISPLFNKKDKRKIYVMARFKEKGPWCNGIIIKLVIHIHPAPSLCCSSSPKALTKIDMTIMGQSFRGFISFKYHS